MWETIKSPFVWLQNKWLKFEAWCASIAPGIKTQTVAFLGLLGNAAATTQEYFSGLPLDKFITGTQLLVANMVLFSLAFWFRRLNKVNS